MKQKIINTLKVFIFLSIGSFLLYIAFKEVDINSVKSKVLHAKYSWIVLSLIFAIGGYISRAYRWRILINSLGYKPKVKNVFNALIFGYFANFILPRFGELVRCGSLKKSEDISFKSLIGTVIVERAIDLIVLLFLTFIAFFSKINFFGNFLKSSIVNPIYYKFLSLFTLPLITWALIIFILSIIIVGIYIIIKKFKFINKINKLLSGIWKGLKSIKNMKHKKEFIFHTIFIWVMYFFMTYVVFFAIQPTSNLKAIDGLFILVVGGLGMSVPVPGGFGSFHIIVPKAIALYGILIEDGLVFATISHESQSLLIILLSIISAVSIFISNKKSSRNFFNFTNSNT